MSAELENNEELENAPEQEFEDNIKTGYINDPDEYVRVTGKPRETFRSKDEYDEFGSLKSQIKELTDEVKQWKTTAKGQAVLYTQLDQKAYERAYNEIQERMMEAAAVGDTASFQVHQQELQQKTWENQQKIQQAQQEHYKNLEAQFIERNKDWYNQDHPDLVNKAHVLLKKYIVGNPNVPIHEVAKLVEDEIREFHAPQKTKQSSAPSFSRSQSGSNKSAAVSSKLPAKHRADYLAQKEKIERSCGVTWTEADYLKYLEKFGD